MKPVFSVYSSFLQRGFDELVTDVCLQKLPVIFAIDRAGLVGADGETHQGIFDLSYLSTIPGMTVLSPKNAWELADMLRFAVGFDDGPIAIRYPRGQAYDGFREKRAPIEYGKSEKLIEGSEVTIVAEGVMIPEAVRVVSLLEKEGLHPALVNARFIKPLDVKLLEEEGRKSDLIVTMEENMVRGGFGEAVLDVMDQTGCLVPVEKIGIEDCFVPHGTVNELRRLAGIDAESVANRILAKYQSLKKKPEADI